MKPCEKAYNKNTLEHTQTHSKARACAAHMSQTNELFASWTRAALQFLRVHDIITPWEGFASPLVLKKYAAYSVR